MASLRGTQKMCSSFFCRKFEFFVDIQVEMCGLLSFLIIGQLFYAFGFSQLSTKYETTKPPAMRVVSKNVIQNNHHSFYNEGVQAIKIRKNGDYNG